MIPDPLFFLMIAPAVVLALWAQYRVHSAYQAAGKEPAPLSGAAAARHILDSAGLGNVAIEQTDGYLSDHYDPRHKVLRLSPQVFQQRSLAAVGIAAHEAGHALQDAEAYAPLVVRNAVVPIAGFGSGVGLWMVMLGVFVSWLHFLVLPGIILFGTVVFFQLVNLPVEFDASARAKERLVALGIVPPMEMPHVNNVLTAAAWTYVAATLQAVLTLIYLLYRSRQ